MLLRVTSIAMPAERQMTAATNGVKAEEHAMRTTTRHIIPRCIGATVGFRLSTFSSEAIVFFHPILSYMMIAS